MFPKKWFFLLYFYCIPSQTGHFSFLTLPLCTVSRLHDRSMHSLGNSALVSDSFNIGTFFRVCKEMSFGVFLVEDHTHLISGHTSLGYEGGIHYILQ